MAQINEAELSTYCIRAISYRIIMGHVGALMSQMHMNIDGGPFG